MTLLPRRPQILGKLKAEGRKENTGREGAFFSSSFCMTIWKPVFESECYWEIVWGRKRCFSLCISYFNTCIFIWERETEAVWKLWRLRGEKEKPDSMARVCNFCMRPCSSQCSCILSWIIVELSSSILDDFYVSPVWKLSVSALNMLLLPANKGC